MSTADTLSTLAKVRALVAAENAEVEEYASHPQILSAHQVDDKINRMTNVELLTYIAAVEEIKNMPKSAGPNRPAEAVAYATLLAEANLRKALAPKTKG